MVDCVDELDDLPADLVLTLLRMTCFDLLSRLPLGVVSTGVVETSAVFVGVDLVEFLVVLRFEDFLGRLSVADVWDVDGSMDGASMADGWRVLYVPVAGMTSMAAV